MIEALLKWSGLLGSALATGAIFYSWLTSRSKDNSVRLTFVEGKVIEHGTTIALIQTELSHLPDKDMVTDLRIEIAKLSGVVGRLDAQLTGLSQTVGRVDTFLRDGDK